MPQYGEQKKPIAPESVEESAERAGRFGSRLKTMQGGDAVKKLQDFAKSEAERKKKKKQEEDAKPVEPQKGFISKMIDKYWYGKKDE